MRPETRVKTVSVRLAVQNLLMNGAFPVDGARSKIYFASDGWENAAEVRCAWAFVNRFACLRPRNA
jgi:hypothetical protein